MRNNISLINTSGYIVVIIGGQQQAQRAGLQMFVWHAEKRQER